MILLCCQNRTWEICNDIIFRYDNSCCGLHHYWTAAEEKDDEGDEEESDDEDLAEGDEDETDLDLAWKMLDVARAIAEKNSGDTMEKVDVLSALAEVALERGLSPPLNNTSITLIRIVLSHSLYSV